MLQINVLPTTHLILPGDEERALYESLISEDYFLCRLLRAVDFESFRPLLAGASCAN